MATIYESLFDDTTVVQKAQAHLRALPTFRDTGWRPLQPHQWPDMSQCCFIAHDTENKELDFDNGAGWGRGQVSNVGHSLTGYWRDGSSKSIYLPKRHEIDTHLNLPIDKVDQYVRDCLHTPTIPKGYANGIYDIGTSTEDSVFVQGPLHEIQFAEALLTEDDNVRLESLAHKYLGEGKTSNQLYEWCAAAYGGEPNSNQRANIYRTSPVMTGPYAEQDSALIRPILWAQWSRMDEQQLLDLYRIETKLIRLLVRMRMQGVRIDLPFIETLSNPRNTGTVDVALIEKIREFHHISGVHTSDSCPTGDIATAFDKFNIRYRTTEKTNKPSITADDLKLIPHPLAKLALEIRQLGKVKSTFIQGTLLSKHCNGVVHGSFEPMRGDAGGGARTGRFVSNNPNLQTIPIRTEIGKQIRQAFVPFHDHKAWEKIDFSQFEYRILAHFAVDRIGGTDRQPVFGRGPSSDFLRRRYQTDPKTDYHDATGEMVKVKTNLELPRKKIKTINFGLMNLMGEELLSLELSLPRKEVKSLLAAYHDANPYVRASAKYYETIAQVTGYVRTELGRYRRFDKYEPIPKWDAENNSFIKFPALSYEHALRVYGSHIQRAKCHTALNSKTQGTNADGMKKWMVDCDEAGLFDVTGVPTITLHDELDFSVIDDSPGRVQAHAEVKAMAERVFPGFSVPIRADVGRGPNWGSIA